VGEGAQVEGPQAILEAAGPVVAQEPRASANTVLLSKVVGYTVPETPETPKPALRAAADAGRWAAVATGGNNPVIAYL
jgi:hypothetical protein